MSASVPFIASYELKYAAPAGIPFMIEKLSSDTTQDERMLHVHRHDFYAIGLCLEGRSTHLLDFRQVTIGTGEMLMIIPGQIHQALNLNGHDSDGYLLAFTADFLLPMSVTLPTAVTTPVRLPQADLQQARMIFSQLRKEYIERMPRYVAMLQHYLALLIQLYQRHTTTNILSGPPLLIRYRELLSRHFTEWTKPAQYAKALHVTTDHLNDVVKQHTGHTVSSHINQKRILEAKRLLLHAKESIKEIAWYLQFNEVSYFNRFFKQHTGFTPAAFREQGREKYLSNPD